MTQGIVSFRFATCLRIGHSDSQFYVGDLRESTSSSASSPGVHPKSAYAAAKMYESTRLHVGCGHADEGPGTIVVSTVLSRAETARDIPHRYVSRLTAIRSPEIGRAV
jgi:hypothetical protein